MNKILAALTILLLFKSGQLLFADGTAAQIATNAPDQKAPDKLEQQILGDWNLVNSSGTDMGPMQINKTDHDTFALIRIGGGPFAVCGEYTIGKMQRLVKVKKAGDAYWDLTWQYFNGKLVLKDGQYKGWTLHRPSKFTK